MPQSGGMPYVRRPGPARAPARDANPGWPAWEAPSDGPNRGMRLKHAIAVPTGAAEALRQRARQRQPLHANPRAHRRQINQPPQHPALGTPSNRPFRFGGVVAGSGGRRNVSRPLSRTRVRRRGRWRAAQNAPRDGVLTGCSASSRATPPPQGPRPMSTSANRPPGGRRGCGRCWSCLRTPPRQCQVTRQAYTSQRVSHMGGYRQASQRSRL